MAFYITAPSNASMELYPANTLTEYTVHLPKTIDLEGPYEVALTSFQYTRSWNNVAENSNVFEYSINGIKISTAIDVGFYETEEDLLESISKAIVTSLKKKSLRNEDLAEYLNHCSAPKFILLQYNRKSRRVSLYLKANTSISFQVKMAEMLGFEQSDFAFHTESKPVETNNPMAVIGGMTVHGMTFRTHKENTYSYEPGEISTDSYLELLRTSKEKGFCSVREVDLNQGLYMLYVYCNIVEEQIVGNSMVPLLKIVPVEGRHGENVTKEYINPQYVPVYISHISDLLIRIRDDAGEKVPFGRGRVQATLHFRRKGLLS